MNKERDRAALYDDLTGLPTRRALCQAFETVLAAPTADQKQLLCLGLDRFRLMNDARGHEFGDRVLIAAAQRIRDACLPGEMVCRMGGDEFAVLYTWPEPSTGRGALPERLLRSLAEPHAVDGETLSITASIGVVTADRDASAATLLRNAAIALNHAKDGGGNRVCHYTRSIRAARQERFQLEQSLRQAVGSDAFGLVYQPIVAIGSREVVGFEALLRWTDRVRGDVPPALFIPMAEATGLMVQLGRSVLERACFEAARWPTKRTIAVNVSPAQFHGDDMLETVRGALARSGLAAERLEVEVTEGLLLQNTGAVLDTVNALRRMGVRLTLDDFGVGHAGLSYLRQFPFDKMKIDGSFIQNLGRDRSSDAIVEATLLLGQRLEMNVVAEGVETERQLEQLRTMQCAYVQGRLTGLPMSPEQARRL